MLGGPSVTVTGRTCQRWDATSPHHHTKNDPSMFAGGITSLADIANWCRNPDGEALPWCYTTDYAVTWQSCDVPFCNGELKWHFILESQNKMHVWHTTFCGLYFIFIECNGTGF